MPNPATLTITMQVGFQTLVSLNPQDSSNNPVTLGTQPALSQTPSGGAALTTLSAVNSNSQFLVTAGNTPGTATITASEGSVSADITVNIIAAPLDHFAPSNSTPAPA